MKHGTFVSFDEVRDRLNGKRVAIVGSGPSCTVNSHSYIDHHDLVLRINNYKLGPGQGYRTDIFYSFFGSSIRKRPDELKRDGVKLCMSKVPNSKPINSQWHERNRRMNGIDFRYIYVNREFWWFCDTYIPDDERFLRGFNLLNRHVPTTGFAAILDVLDCEPAEVFVTGFDGFTSGVHNVNERWKKGDQRDPIGHRPELELDWIAANASSYPLKFDRTLKQIVLDRQEALA